MTDLAELVQPLQLEMNLSSQRGSVHHLKQELNKIHSIIQAKKIQSPKSIDNVPITTLSDSSNQLLHLDDMKPNITKLGQRSKGARRFWSDDEVIPDPQDQASKASILFEQVMTRDFGQEKLPPVQSFQQQEHEKLTEADIESKADLLEFLKQRRQEQEMLEGKEQQTVIKSCLLDIINMQYLDRTLRSEIDTLYKQHMALNQSEIDLEARRQVLEARKTSLEAQRFASKRQHKRRVMAPTQEKKDSNLEPEWLMYLKKHSGRDLSLSVPNYV
jgi:hypothetical protein